MQRVPPSCVNEPILFLQGFQNRKGTRWVWVGQGGAEKENGPLGDPQVVSLLQQPARSPAVRSLKPQRTTLLWRSG